MKLEWLQNFCRKGHETNNKPLTPTPLTGRLWHWGFFLFTHSQVLSLTLRQKCPLGLCWPSFHSQSRGQGVPGTARALQKCSGATDCSQHSPAQCNRLISFAISCPYPRDNTRFGLIYCSVTPHLLYIYILCELQKQLDIAALKMCFRCCYNRKKSNAFCSYKSIFQWNWKAQRYCHECGTTVIVTGVWKFIVKPRNTWNEMIDHDIIVNIWNIVISASYCFVHSAQGEFPLLHSSGCSGLDVAPSPSDLTPFIHPFMYLSPNSVHSRALSCPCSCYTEQICSSRTRVTKFPQGKKGKKPVSSPELSRK